MFATRSGEETTAKDRILFFGEKEQKRKTKKNLRVQSLLLVTRRLCNPPLEIQVWFVLDLCAEKGQKKRPLSSSRTLVRRNSPLRCVRSGTCDSATVGASVSSIGKSPSPSTTIGQRGFQGTNLLTNEHPYVFRRAEGGVAGEVTDRGDSQSVAACRNSHNCPEVVSTH